MSLEHFLSALCGKTVLVADAGRGLGVEIARLAAAGARVVISDVLNGTAKARQLRTS